MRAPSAVRFELLIDHRSAKHFQLASEFLQHLTYAVSLLGIPVAVQVYAHLLVELVEVRLMLAPTSGLFSEHHLARTGA